MFFIHKCPLNSKFSYKKNDYPESKNKKKFLGTQGVQKVLANMENNGCVERALSNKEL